MAVDAFKYDPAYDMAAIMGVVDGTTGADEIARPGSRVLVVDVLSQAWQEMLANINFWREHVWRGQKLTTLCYLHHGCTSTYNIVLAFNGLGTPMELRPGMILRIPLLSEIQKSLPTLTTATSRASQLGKTVRI